MKKLLVILTLGFLALTQTADAFIARRPWRWRYGYPGYRYGGWRYRHGYYGHPYHGFYHRY